MHVGGGSIRRWVLAAALGAVLPGAAAQAGPVLHEGLTPRELVARWAEVSGQAIDFEGDAASVVTLLLPQAATPRDEGQSLRYTLRTLGCTVTLPTVRCPAERAPPSALVVVLQQPPVEVATLNRAKALLGPEARRDARGPRLVLWAPVDAEEAVVRQLAALDWGARPTQGRARVRARSEERWRTLDLPLEAVSEHHVRIPAEGLDAWSALLNEPEPLQGIVHLARLVPNRGPQGDIDGYRLSGLVEGSPLWRLGLRNGDVVHEAAGIRLSSMAEAVEGVRASEGRLAVETRYEIELTREAEGVRLVVEVER